MEKCCEYINKSMKILSKGQANKFLCNFCNNLPVPVTHIF